MHRVLSSVGGVFKTIFYMSENLARAYHLKKIPSLLLKLNISKAFDTVSWEYLLELLLHRGFPVA
jgi:hypothetical protein